MQITKDSQNYLLWLKTENEQWVPICKYHVPPHKSKTNKQATMNSEISPFFQGRLTNLHRYAQMPCE